MILARALHPWYDERFAGYGWDKVRSHAGSIGRGRPVVLQRLSRPPSVHALLTQRAPVRLHAFNHLPCH